LTNNQPTAELPLSIISFPEFPEEPFLLGGIVFHVYVLRNAVTGRLYTGSTADIQDRLRRHNSGESKATWRGKRHPFSIEWSPRRQVGRSNPFAPAINQEAMRDLSAWLSSCSSSNVNEVICRIMP
jgi:hypothetical protein